MNQFEYPRPQLVRDHWISLNGPWRFMYDDERRCQMPNCVDGWTHEIDVRPWTDVAWWNDNPDPQIDSRDKGFAGPQSE